MINSLFHDIKVHIIDDDKITTFKSHKIALSKSQVFKKVLLENPKLDEIKIHCSLEIFKSFFGWMYYGKMTYDKSQSNEIMKFAFKYEFDIQFKGASDGFKFQFQ